MLIQICSLACTAADGTLSFAEIQDILSRNSGATPVYDQTAQVKYLVYDTVSLRSKCYLYPTLTAITVL